MPATMPLAVAIERLSSPEPNTGCFLWTGAIQKDGYGILTNKGRSLLAHRAAWEVKHGPVPHGMLALHKCDVPWCVNADSHLYLGTQFENMRDSVRRKRHCNSKKTHCKRGHALSGETLYSYVNKGRPARNCTACHNASAVARRARAKQGEK